MRKCPEQSFQDGTAQQHFHRALPFHKISNEEQWCVWGSAQVVSVEYKQMHLWHWGSHKAWFSHCKKKQRQTSQFSDIIYNSMLWKVINLNWLKHVKTLVCNICSCISWNHEVLHEEVPRFTDCLILLNEQCAHIFSLLLMMWFHKYVVWLPNKYMLKQYSFLGVKDDCICHFLDPVLSCEASAFWHKQPAV